MRRLLAALVLVMASAACAAASAPDLIFVKGKLITLDGERPHAEAMAVTRDRIEAIGANAEIRALAGPHSTIVDLDGRTVIPGLIDSHIHAIRAGLTWLTEVHWIGARSLNEALARLRDAAERTPPGSWVVVAGGWTERQFAEDRWPTQAEVMAAAPGHHVYIQLLYSRVLLGKGDDVALGLTTDADLKSRLTFEHDRSGQPTGWIAANNRDISRLFDKLPKPDMTQKIAGTKAFFRELNSLGLTGVLDPGGYNLPIADYSALFKIYQARQMTVRVAYNVCAPRRGHELEDFQALTGVLPNGLGDDWLRFNGIGENVTWGMYGNEHPTEADKDALYRVLKWAAARGLRATFHWHNDASVHHLLDVLARVDHDRPIAPLRWFIAHLNDASVGSLKRMKALGVGWTMQDAFYFRGEAFLGQRGTEAARHAPPIVTGLRMGVHIGGGTDAHRVMSYNPFVSLQWMLDGKTVGGIPMRAPEELPTREEALRIYTLGSAWFAGWDRERGSLTPGKLADFAVLDQDYETVPVARIGETHSLLTVVGGELVYAAGPYRRLEQAARPSGGR
ncbi:MAG TPA: amidohydrolase [Pseudolabrys sp.]|nr:amidohydrolase [Pseudolabrys sp.]